MPRLDRGIHAHACGHAHGRSMDPAVTAAGDRTKGRAREGVEEHGACRGPWARLDRQDAKELDAYEQVVEGGHDPLAVVRQIGDDVPQISHR